MTYKLALLFWIGGFACPVIAASGLKPDGHLDMPEIRQSYLDGEFAAVRETLEGFRKNHPKNVSLDEKIFTHMFLGILCAADSGSPAKAESHFNALLQLSPHAQLAEMPMPPGVEALFDRIKKDFLKSREPPLPAASAPAISAGPRHAWVWWTAGSAAAVAAGLGVYALVAGGDAPSPNRYTADGTLK